MKRMTSLAALLLFTLTAHAHVLLTTPYSVLLGRRRLMREPG